MKTALITGANRLDGIGFHAALGLIEHGWRVFITARSKASATEALERLGRNAELIELDLNQSASIANLGQEVSQRTDVLDVLVNNAGVVLDWEKDVLHLDEQAFVDTFRVNTLAPILVIQQLVPLLRKSGSPRIVNVSSGAGQISDGEPANWAPIYSASKAALNALTQQLSVALPDFAVNSLCPGWCKTHMGGPQAPRTAAQGADSIVWLVDEAPQTLTGQFIRDRKSIAW
jgi:NAD(P)-dependent dehydrogenase (short-subunit alcohol dehydrogenase family)